MLCLSGFQREPINRLLFGTIFSLGAPAILETGAIEKRSSVALA